MRTRAVLLAYLLAQAGIGQSLALVAISDPAVHGSGADSSVHLQHAGSDALYFSAFGPGAGIWQTVSRWRPSSGLTVLGSTPYGSDSFRAAVEVGGFTYFGALGIWKSPNNGSGLTLASASWPSSFGGPVHKMATDGAAVWFVSANPTAHLGRLDPATGVVTDFGAPFGGQVFGVAGDATGIYCFAYSPLTATSAIYRFETATSTFSLLTLFPRICLAV